MARLDSFWGYDTVPESGRFGRLRTTDYAHVTFGGARRELFVRADASRSEVLVIRAAASRECASEVVSSGIRPKPYSSAYPPHSVALGDVRNLEGRGPAAECWNRAHRWNSTRTISPDEAKNLFSFLAQLTLQRTLLVHGGDPS
jgi:hypothetical protein